MVVGGTNLSVATGTPNTEPPTSDSTQGTGGMTDCIEDCPSGPAMKKSSNYCVCAFTPNWSETLARASANAEKMFGADLRPKGNALSSFAIPPYSK